jgi:hypothetical protein
MAENPRRIFPLPAGSALMRLLALAVACASGFAAGPLHAAGVLSISPQGEARDVRQVAVRFDADMVPLGQSDGTEPATLQCSPQTPEGRARWTGPRAWAFEFAADVRGGTRCNVVFKPGLKTLAGDAVTTPPTASFVAGPYGFFGSYPAEGAEVAPDQVFLLRHYAPPPTDDPQTLAAGFTCEQRDGDKVVRQPAVAVTGAALAAAVRAAPRGVAYALGLRCAQPLPEGVQLRLSQAAVGNAEPKRFNYTVRPRFTAKVGCTVLDDPQGGKGCDPRRPVSLDFSSGIGLARAGTVRLTDGQGADLSFDITDRWRLRRSAATARDAAQGKLRRGHPLHRAPARRLARRAGPPAGECGGVSEDGRFRAPAALPRRGQPARGDAVASGRVRRGGRLCGAPCREVGAAAPVAPGRRDGRGHRGLRHRVDARPAGRPVALRAAHRQGRRAPHIERSTRSGGAMEFVGVPLTAPGLHVVRADSAAFAQYIDTRTLPAGQARDTAPRQRYAVVQATNLNPGASFSDARRLGGLGHGVRQRASPWRVPTWPCIHATASCCGAARPMRRAWRSRRGAARQARVPLRQRRDARGAALRWRWRQQQPLGGGARRRRHGAHAGLGRLERLLRAGATRRTCAPTPCSTAPCSRPARRSSMQHVVRAARKPRLRAAAGGHARRGDPLRLERQGAHAASVPLGTDGSATHQWTIPVAARLGGYTVAGVAGRSATRQHAVPGRGVPHAGVRQRTAREGAVGARCAAGGGRCAAELLRGRRGRRPAGDRAAGLDAPRAGRRARAMPSTRKPSTPP